MKKIEAYQASDGKRFLKKSDAQNHEDRLNYRSKIKEVENYLYNLLGIEWPNPPEEDGNTPEELLSDMLIDEGISGLFDEAVELEVIIELIIDIATILDGALLKTAQYAKDITTLDKKGK